MTAANMGGVKTLAVAVVVGLAALVGASVLVGPSETSRVGETTGAETTGTEATPPADAGKPNIVFVVADDLAKRDMRAVGRHVNPYTAEEGTVFSRAYVTAPVCCPSQASILRGQYVHNHKVYNHNVENGGDAYKPFEPLEGSTLATWLDDAGYETARYGKYLVDHDLEDAGGKPPGWDTFDVWERNTENLKQDGDRYVLNTGGGERTYDADAASPDTIIAGRAGGFIRENRGEPMFVYMGLHSPHDEHAYPDRYASRFSSASYGAPCERDLSDKPGYVRRFAREACFGGGEEYRERLRAMLTLRDALARIEDALRETGELENTYLFFTSDNGYHLGEHRMPPGKRLPYLEDVEVPLHVRGPGIEAGSASDALVSLADLAPTAAAWGGAETPGFVDGRDLSPLFHDPRASWRDALLVEGYSEGFLNTRHPAPTYGTVVTKDRSYTRYATGESELYDLEADPDQLDSLHGKRPREEARLSDRLDGLRACAGESCRAADSP